MQSAGLPAIQSFNMSLISLSLGLLGTLLSWSLMSVLGRRTIHFSGACTLFVLLVVVGSLSFSPTKTALWAIGALLIAFVFVYDATIGPVTYSIVSEMSSTRLKAKTIVLARAGYNVSNIVVNVLTVSGSDFWNVGNGLILWIELSTRGGGVGLGCEDGVFLGGYVWACGTLGVFQVSALNLNCVREMGLM